MRRSSSGSGLKSKVKLTSLRFTTEATPPTWTTGTYRYDTSGNIYAIGVAGDAGSPVQHRYGYDELSRLKYADTITTSTHSEAFTYDAYGNMTEHVDGGATTSTPADTATNRLQWSAAHPYTYDEVGNLKTDYNATYAYDPFNMLREKDYQGKQPEYYVYTAGDERIGGKYASYPDSATVWSIRDFSGNVLRQFEGHDAYPAMSWLWIEDYVYADGRLLAAERVPEEGGRRHFHLDHLGSPRLVTGQDGREMSEHDFEPFGLECNPQWQETAGGFDREDPKRFTGHERDYASDGADSARQTHGRFFGSLLSGHANIEVSMGTGRTHDPDHVFAGSIFSDKTLSANQQLQAIGNAIVHETAAHQFHSTYVEAQDQLWYLRGTIAAQKDPALSARYGTVADSYAFVWPDTKSNVTNGPIPINPDDLRVLQQYLRPVHAEPPEDR